MSSFRNAAQRRNHRERVQPLERQKWGLLEKHKDYQLRARDYKSKQTRLKALRERASTRNPDEYYFGMTKERTLNNRPIVGRGNQVLDDNQLKILKTQDAGYLRTLRSQEKKAMERLLHMDKGNGRHQVFVNDKQEALSFDPTKHFQTPAEFLDRPSNRPTVEQLKSNVYTPPSTAGLSKKQIERFRLRQSKELEARKERDERLRKVENEMDLQRKLMTKGERKKFTKDDGTVVYKWKPQRKR